MSYELSFSPEFFLAEGEPYDGGPEPSDKPVSVWHAIESMRVLRPEQWRDMAREVFGLDAHPEYLTEESVLDKVRETNTCSNLHTPVRVWVDEAGHYTLSVYQQAA